MDRGLKYLKVEERFKELEMIIEYKESQSQHLASSFVADCLTEEKVIRPRQGNLYTLTHELINNEKSP